MLRKIIVLSCVFALFVVMKLRSEPQDNLPQATGDYSFTVKGEVVELWGYLKDGQHGPDHKETALESVKRGNPLGILTETGQVYLVFGSNGYQSGRELLGDRLTERVIVQGRLVRRSGLQAIYMLRIQE